MRADAPVYWGACEAMATPRPLGALDDIAIDSGGKLAIAHDGSGERHRLFVAFLDLLAERPALAVLEDVHWADEATLDLLRYAGRRIARTRSLLVASFRNDEVVPSHPLRAVLGDLATAGAPRLAPQPLSLAAVRSLAGGTRTSMRRRLHAQTAGNPFFVTEVLAATAKAVQGVPATVQDAVLARAGRLSPSARAVLDAAAVAGPRAEAWLLRELTAAESGSIEECLATGVLRVEGAAFVFRHELARQAVLQAMAPTRALGLHRLVLQALLASDATRDRRPAGAPRRGCRRRRRGAALGAGRGARSGGARRAPAGRRALGARPRALRAERRARRDCSTHRPKTCT